MKGFCAGYVYTLDSMGRVTHKKLLINIVSVYGVVITLVNSLLPYTYLSRRFSLLLFLLHFPATCAFSSIVIAFRFNSLAIFGFSSSTLYVTIFINSVSFHQVLWAFNAMQRGQKQVYSQQYA